ncbi:MAG TPA: alginate export family protein, partial [Blastocatellia bacterium]|nr:alginate export family protein [Blastocatellia bacterium]
EFIDLFANNHIHYGYMDFLGWRNMVDYRVNAGFNPLKNLAFDADYHKFFLHREGGRWSDANGRTLGFDPFGLTGKNLGQELDFTLSFPYKEHIKLLTGYSTFFSGRFAKFRNGREQSHFSYIQMLIGF